MDKETVMNVFAFHVSDSSITKRNVGEFDLDVEWSTTTEPDA